MTTKDQRPKLNPVIYEEAADWIVELREGEVDAAVRERLDAWFRTSPEHIRAYLELSSIWEEGADPDLDRAHTTDELMAFARSSSNVVSLGLPSSNSAELQGEPAAQRPEVLPSVESSPASRKAARDSVPRWRRRWRPVWLSGGAVVCVAAALSLYVYRERNISFATETGEQRFEKLVDGSTIELNAKSRVRIRYSAHERNVDLLEGQVLFHVAKDAARPFIVRSDSTLVRAVGTQFDVYRRDTGTTVTVVEGRVAVLSPLFERGKASGDENEQGTAPRSGAVPALHALPRKESRAENTMPGAAGLRTDPARLSNDRNAVFLDAGEQLTVGSQGFAEPTRTDAAVATAWTQHELVFEATPLIDVAREFNRYNTRQLVIDDPALAGIQITGVFSSADASSLLKFLRAQHDIAVQETDGDIRIVKK